MGKQRILITGSNGLLGQKVNEIFSAEGDFNIVLTDLQHHSESPKSVYISIDLTKKDEVKELVRTYKPEVIINTAAFTNVDACESERELSWRVNVDGVKNLIIASKMCNAKLIHISTDYVFDGKTGNYDEHSKPNPKSFYGKAKLASENAVIASGIPYAIIRTMVLYGTGTNIRPNFALWLIDKLGNNEPVNIVDDQFGQPTIVDDVALAIFRIVDRKSKGIYNVSGSEYVSRYEFAVRLADIFELDKNLISPVKTSTLKQAADRPMNSSFITIKAQTELGIKPLDVYEGLHYLKQQLGYSKEE